MLLSFEFPDRTSDLTVEKKTLAVRFGLRGAAWVVDALIPGAFLFLGILTFYFKFSEWRIGWALPLAIWLMMMVHWIISSLTRSHYYILTTGSAGLFIFASLFAVSGFVFVL